MARKKLETKPYFLTRCDFQDSLKAYEDAVMLLHAAVGSVLTLDAGINLKAREILKQRYDELSAVMLSEDESGGEPS